MPADTAPAWPDPARISAEMDRAGHDFLASKPNGAYLEWRHARAEAVIRLFDAAKHQHALAQYAAGWLAAREACCDWAKLMPSDASQSEIELARQYVALIRMQVAPPADASAALSDLVRREVEREREACAALLDDFQRELIENIQADGDAHREDEKTIKPLPHALRWLMHAAAVIRARQGGTDHG